MYGKLGLVPRSLRDGVLTPYSVTVALFIRDYFYVSAQDPDTGGPGAPEFEKFPEFNARHRFLAARLVIRLIEGPPVTFDRLLLLFSHVMNELPPEVWTAFHARLRKIVASRAVAEKEISSLPHICTGMVGIAEMTSKKYKFCSGSRVGIFLRKLMMVVDAVDVQEITRTALALIKYLKPGMKSAREALQPCGAHKDPEKYLDKAALENVKHAVPSYWGTVTASKFLDRQCSFLRANDSRALPPNELLPLLDQIKKCCPTLKAVHHCAHLSAVRARNYPSAEKELHKIWDNAKDPVEGLANHHFDSWEVITGAFRGTALNAATLHAEFNQKRNALMSAFESLREARRAHDETSLQRASIHLWDNSPLISIERIEDMIIKLLDGGQPILAVDRILWLLRSGYAQSVKPLRMFEIMYELEQVCGSEWLWDLLIKAFTHHSSYWSFLGQHEMVQVYSAVAIRLRSVPARDLVGNRDEMVATMACAQAHCAFVNGDSRRAREIIGNAMNAFGCGPGGGEDLRYSSMWLSLSSYIDCKKALRKGDLDKAVDAAKVYKAHRPLQGTLIEAEVLMYSDQPLASLEIVQALIKELKKILWERDFSSKKHSLTEVAHVLAEALLLESQIHFLAGEAPKAVVVISDATSVAEQHHFVLLQYLASAHMANALSLLDAHAEAMALLDNVELDLYGFYDLETMARFDYLRGKVIARRIVGQEDTEVSEEMLDDGLGALRRAIERFEELEDKPRMKHAIVLKDVFLMMKSGTEGCEEVAKDCEIVRRLGEGLRISPDIPF